MPKFLEGLPEFRREQLQNKELQTFLGIFLIPFVDWLNFVSASDAGVWCLGNTSIGVLCAF